MDREIEGLGRVAVGGGVALGGVEDGLGLGEGEEPLGDGLEGDEGTTGETEGACVPVIVGRISPRRKRYLVHKGLSLLSHSFACCFSS